MRIRLDVATDSSPPQEKVTTALRSVCDALQSGGYGADGVIEAASARCEGRSKSV